MPRHAASERETFGRNSHAVRRAVNWLHHFIACAPMLRLPDPYRAEIEVVAALARSVEGALDWPSAETTARPWVQAVRDHPAPFWALESLLQEYPITGAEGLALMRLAEALARVPDAETAVALTTDQLGRARFDTVTPGPHRMLAELATSAIAWSKRLLPDAEHESGLLARLGAQTVVAATVRAIQLLGRQFVLGRSINEALREAAKQHSAQPRLRFSYDMLGEGARTDPDALRYLAAYSGAITAIGANRRAAPEQSDGISIKLSALYPRYEALQRERVFAVLLPRVLRLVDAAAAANLNLTIDAEESERLELSLDLFEAIAAHVSANAPQWRGLGLAVQAYQTRAVPVIDEVARVARARNLRLMVRLVKGAYWDSEIKRAQELGVNGYPVYTHKHHTDISYLACAKALLSHAGAIYPQFATHNAGTIAAIAQMAGAAAFEMQRLHGMGEAVYREVLAHSELPLRVYAPVGEHRDLLAYLVRRLLENGANSSFVNQLGDAAIDLDTLLASPLQVETAPALPLPPALYGARRNSRGIDLAVAADRAPLTAALAATIVPAISDCELDKVSNTMQRLAGGFAVSQMSLDARCATLKRAALALESRIAEFASLLVREGGKTWADALAEVREAVDFCRYYAAEASGLREIELPGPTGETNTLRLTGRGVFVCISPWNFPLAIFTGQVAAAWVCGNSVAAKPAEQTPAIAACMVALLYRCGMPDDTLALLAGPGETVGAALVADPHTAGVCFTGSTAVAKTIQRALAAKEGPIVPLIAETGGINAMIVDSTALAEQVTDAVVASAFRSAGQRCSALRLLCVHESIADAVFEMIRGALHELVVGDPANFDTDVGPLIDAAAHARIARHVARLKREARFIGEAPIPPLSASALTSRLFPPIAFEIGGIADLREEIFGPVLHVVRWGGEVEAVIDQINALGYGLTLGLQTRIDSRALRLAGRARIGNVYVNRNQIGAVVGVQPFGGVGLSGTGPKAGGPHYLARFCGEQTLTINTAAAGGNIELLTHVQS